MLAVRILRRQVHLQHGGGPRPAGWWRSAPATCSPGTLGTRRALRGYAGVVPTSHRRRRHHRRAQPRRHPGHVHLGQSGDRPAVQGRGAGRHPRVPGTGRPGRPAGAHQGPRGPAGRTLESQVPVVYVAGTCMNAGKTVAATELVRGLDPQRAPGGGGQADRRLADARRALDARCRRRRGAHLQRRRHREHPRRASRCRRPRASSTGWPAVQARRDRGRAGRRHPGRVRRAGHPARRRADRVSARPTSWPRPIRWAAGARWS